jgi:hypothetical protein
MANLEIKKSVWSMISPEAKDRMMEKGDVIILKEEGKEVGREVWTKPRVPVPIIRKPAPPKE